MDAERAIQHVEAFLGLLRTNHAAFALKDEIFASNSQWRETQEQILSRRPLILAIAEDLDHTVAEKMRRRSSRPWEWEDAEEATAEILGLLRDRDEFQAVLGRAGPANSVARVHRAIWQNVATAWGEARFHEAVKDASVFVLGTLLPRKLDRFDLTGIGLVTEAFSVEPPRPGRPRLRLPSVTPDTEAWEAAHSAAEHLGIGCALAVRSLTGDHLGHLDENAALDLLIGLSTFARWVDQADVARCGHDVPGPRYG